MKYLLIALSLMCLNPLPGGVQWVAAQDKPAVVPEEKKDDTAKSILDKITFYQSELKKNAEAIQALEKELEERKKLNERLSGAIVASQEILNSMAQSAPPKRDPAEGGTESKAPDKEQKNK